MILAYIDLEFWWLFGGGLVMGSVAGWVMRGVVEREKSVGFTLDQEWMADEILRTLESDPEREACKRRHPSNGGGWTDG